MKPSLIAKGAEAVAARLAALGQEMAPPVTVPHEAAAVAAAIRRGGGRDGADPRRRRPPRTRRDTCPSGLVAAGGRLIRFGMPVDPGNLLFLGEHGGRPVVGLPGCARSPAVNGADWVLERLAAGLGGRRRGDRGDGGGRAAQGDRRCARSRARAGPRRRGGRGWRRSCWRRARAGGCAGATSCSSRWAGGRRCARWRRRRGRAGPTRWWWCCRPAAAARRAALAGLGVAMVEAADWAEGMAASIRAGLAAARARRTRW